MTTQKKENMREALVAVINSFSPEYFDQAEDSDYELSQLLDSIEEFENECDDSFESQEDKYRLPFDPSVKDLLDRLRIRDNA